MMLATLASGLLPAATLLPAKGDDTMPPRDDYQRRKAELTAKALADFPYSRIETTGAEAFAKWQELRQAGRGTPVVLGDDDSIVTMMQSLEPAVAGDPAARSVEQILAVAAKLRFPEDWLVYQEDESARAAAALKAMLAKNPNTKLPEMSVTDADGNKKVLDPSETIAAITTEDRPSVPIGTWPSEPPESAGLSVADQFGTPLPKVSIALIPTADWTEIPAYLKWGGWNACPPPEYHVAAFRSWRDRYGVELVGMGFDTLNFRVARKPASKEEALDLAREQYAYCNDVVDQGVETLSNLAAALMADDWWYFWWD
jgi:hypothetical protein